MSSSRLQGFPVEVNQRVVSQFQVFFHNFLGWNERHFSELLPLCYGNIFCAVWIPYCCSIFHSCSDGGRRGLRVEILVIQRRLASAIVIETKLQLFGYARESDADSASCMWSTSTLCCIAWTMLVVNTRKHRRETTFCIWASMLIHLHA